MLFPANMRRFESDRRVVVPHIETANGALIVVGAQHHLAELWIALAEGMLNIKTQFVSDIVSSQNCFICLTSLRAASWSCECAVDINLKTYSKEYSAPDRAGEQASNESCHG